MRSNAVRPLLRKAPVSNIDIRSPALSARFCFIQTVLGCQMLDSCALAILYDQSLIQIRPTPTLHLLRPIHILAEVVIVLQLSNLISAITFQA